MRVVGVDDEGEDESATLVHSWEDHTRDGQQREGLSYAGFRRASAGKCGGGPLITPSSGVIVSVKLSRSAGSGKWVCMVDGRSSSVKSGKCMRLSFCRAGVEDG